MQYALPPPGVAGRLDESMGAFLDLLRSSPVVLLFTVVGLGYFLGSLRIRGFRLGVGAVLFVGLLLGALDPGLAIPDVIYVLGLVTFVYTVGLQSGPIFFNLFRRQWLGLTTIALAAPLGAAVLTILAARLLHIRTPVAAGLFCGSLTNTPALAAAVDSLRRSLSGAALEDAAKRLALDGPTVGYSIAYPFGVFGVILLMQIVSKALRIDFAAERERAARAAGVAEELLSREVRVANPQLVGKTFGEAMLTDLTGMVFTRIKRGETVDLAEDGVTLQEGDVLVGVGAADAVRKAELLIGPLAQESVERLSPGIEYRDLVVRERRLAGVPVTRAAELAGRPLIVSRLRRGAVQITPRPETQLELGDQIRVVAHRDDLDRVSAVVGDPLKDYSEADFLSFSLGLILGVLLGQVAIPLPGGQTVSLGFAGGPLVVALILGRLGRTGRIVWSMPLNANLTMRQLGLLFFLAGIGVRAGGSFVHTFEDQGVRLLVVGGLATILSAGLSVWLAHRVFHYDMISAYGVVAGVHTQPAALAFANAHTGAETPALSYAAVYPVALIVKIVLAQILVLWSG